MTTSRTLQPLATVYLSILVSACSPQGPVASADSETAAPESPPGIEDTVRFIANLTWLYEASDEKFEIDPGDPCSVTFSHTRLHEYTFSFRDMNPEYIDMEKVDHPTLSHQIRIRTTDAHKKVRHLQGDPRARTEIFESSVILWSHEDGDTKKINDALSHAMKLCGARPDSF